MSSGYKGRLDADMQTKGGQKTKGQLKVSDKRCNGWFGFSL